MATADRPPESGPQPVPSSNPQPITPFLKWAGGKRWLARRHQHLFDTEYVRYIEPFLGGASVFFTLRPSNAVLADCNERLIETYVEIRRDPDGIAASLKRYQRLHSEGFYYSERKRRYANSASKRAAQLIYLNRTCWNGLYRVNLSGEFNVPRGTKSRVVLETDDFGEVASALRGARLLAQDFEDTLRMAGDGDLVYVDPPYTAKHNHNGFLKYNERIFSWDDQVRLKKALAAAVERGAKVALSNADNPAVKELYRDLGEVQTLRRKSAISGKAQYRGQTDELMVRSWWPRGL